MQSNEAATGAATPGTSVTTGGSSNTKGTPAELISSTSFDSYWMKVIALNYGSDTATSEGSMDILIGAATEEVLIPDLLMGFCGYYGSASSKGPKIWDFPLYTPAGSRLAVQAAGARTATAFQVLIYLYGGNGYPPFRIGSKVTTYGIGTVPNGTTVTPGASGAEGTWTQITASTSADHFAFVPSYQVTNDTTTNNRTLQVDIGIGSATEEQIGSWTYATASTESMEGPMNTMPAFQDVPASTRLVGRCSNSGTNDAGYNMCIHCVS